MNKTIFSILLALCIIPLCSYGNDYAQNTELWVRHDKTVCWSLENYHEYKEDILVVFDYSVEIGKLLRRPWNVVEEGKCYEVSDGTEALYVFKLPLSEEYKKIIFHNGNINSEADISDFISSCNNLWDNCENNDLVRRITLGMGGYAMGVSSYDYAEKISSNITQWAPLEYEPRYLYGGASTVTKREVALFGDPRMDDVRNTVTLLTEDMQEMITMCDMRIRIEESGTITLKENTENFTPVSTSKQLWVFPESKVTLSVDHPIEKLYKIGCFEQYKSFLKSHKDEIAEVNTLLRDIINTSYPVSETPYQNDQYLIVLSKSEDRPIMNLLMNATTSYSYESLFPVDVVSPDISDTVTQTIELDSDIIGVTSTPAVVDIHSQDIPKQIAITSTEDKATKISTLESSTSTARTANTFYWVYFILFPLIGISMLLRYRKRNNFNLDKID